MQSLSRATMFVVVVAVAFLVLCASPSSAQTVAVSFLAQSNATVYPQTCTNGTLSCSVNSTSGGYSCTGGTTGGTHYFYPTASAPTFVSQLVTGQPPTLCEQYYADSQLPLTAGGLNVQYGSSSSPVCVNYRIRNGAYTADPDAVDANGITFLYSANSTYQCAAPQPATGSGSATVYFTYLGTGGSGGITALCGYGSLSCTYYGNNQYYCPTLNSGTHYQYNSTTNSYSTVALSGETECNGFGDGYLPLDYEGISFGGSFGANLGCISWYGSSGGTKQGYDFYTSNSVNSYVSYGGTQSFTYSTTAINATGACGAVIPGFTSGGGGNAAAATTSAVSASGLALLSAAVIASIGVF